MELMADVGEDKLDSRPDLLRRRLGSAGIVRVAPVEEQIFVDEYCFAAQQIVARPDPGIVQEAFSRGKRQDPPQQ